VDQACRDSGGSVEIEAIRLLLLGRVWKGLQDWLVGNRVGSIYNNTFGSASDRGSLRTLARWQVKEIR